MNNDVGTTTKVLYALSPENLENLRGRDIALHSSDMITIGGKQHRTIADAARDWSVSTKTVRDWIERRVIPKPPKVRHGTEHNSTQCSVQDYGLYDTNH